ncbi:MAG: ribosomal protein S18-alanine N-acetyltransferase [Lachnospiraceae bacterium]|nr:ribosomal protein S18-alanine N-acetyltransferase [Lachnospiraceae bacterium]
MTGSIIRRMQTEDLAQVTDIEKAVFSDPWSREGFESSMQKTENLYLVVEEEGRIAAYCGLWGVAGEGQICNVAVREDARGRGLAFVMLSELLRQGREAGLSAFTLEVRVSNMAAIHVYRRLGFMGAGIRKNFYTKPNEDALIMWLFCPENMIQA